jgi:hypothetical protein
VFMAFGGSPLFHICYRFDHRVRNLNSFKAHDDQRGVHQIRRMGLTWWSSSIDDRLVKNIGSSYLFLLVIDSITQGSQPVLHAVLVDVKIVITINSSAVNGEGRLVIVDRNQFHIDDIRKAKQE